MSSQLDAKDKDVLDALMRKVPKGARKVTVQALGYVQPRGATYNDESLSTARAKHAAHYLKKEGLDGAYYVSGRSRAKQPGPEARRVDITISYVVGK